MLFTVCILLYAIYSSFLQWSWQYSIGIVSLSCFLQILPDLLLAIFSLSWTMFWLVAVFLLVFWVLFVFLDILVFDFPKPDCFCHIAFSLALDLHGYLIISDLMSCLYMPSLCCYWSLCFDIWSLRYRFADIGVVLTCLSVLVTTILTFVILIM